MDEMLETKTASLFNTYTEGMLLIISRRDNILTFFYTRLQENVVWGEICNV